MAIPKICPLVTRARSSLVYIFTETPYEATMSDLPSDLDLKFLPDWLKEGPSENRYANYQGESPSRGDRDDRERRGGPGRRPGGPGGPGAPGGNRGDRRAGPPKPGGDRGGPRRDARPGERPRPSGPGGNRRDDAPRGRAEFGRRDEAPRPPAAPQNPGVRVEFIPAPNGVAGIAKQIKSSWRAYPLFGTARLFLEKPERHRVRITSLDAERPLFQIEDGPVSFDRAALERDAFRHWKDEFYREETVQSEPLKGKFGNVARSRSTGALLGPTNYHGYQPALRKLYEERFSRRMSFGEFQQEDIQVVTDEQTVNDWKEQARSSTTLSTVKEAEPITFKSVADAEQHFRKTYLPELVKSGVSLETSGTASRAIADRGITNSLRDAWEHERGFPSNIVNALRPVFNEIGLHFFKHRKRIIYIAPIRPERHIEGRNFSEGIAGILGAVEQQPKITRPQLAAKLLGEMDDSPELAAKKTALASDLHYLIHVGHVIEFHDGTLDLPLSPRAEKEEESGKQTAPAKGPKFAGKPKAELAAAVAAEVEPASIAAAGQPTATTEIASIEVLSAEPESAPETVAVIEDFAASTDAAPAVLDEPLLATEIATDPMLAQPDPNATLTPTEPLPAPLAE